LKFYVFNDDLPREWFQLMEKRLETLNSEIVNV
ncbi:glycosyl transferase family 8, partial [Streptococcus pneumoniae]